MKIEDEQGYFNRAYCLYRLARYQEAKQIIEEAGRQENPLSLRLRTLLAQIVRHGRARAWMGEAHQLGLLCSCTV